ACRGAYCRWLTFYGRFMRGFFSRQNGFGVAMRKWKASILDEIIQALHRCYQWSQRTGQRGSARIGKETPSILRLVIIDLYLEGLLCLGYGSLGVNNQVIGIGSGNREALR